MKKHSDGSQNDGSLDTPDGKLHLKELERFRALLEHSHDAVFLIETSSGRLVDVNRSACQCLGFDRDQLLSMSFSDVLPASGWDQISQSLVQEVSASVTGEFIDTVLLGDEDTEIPVEIAISVHAFRDTEYAVAIARHVASRQQAIEQMVRESRMEATLALAAGIAHNLNNLMTVVMSAVDMLQTDFGDDHPHIAILQLAEKAGWRVSHLAKQIVACAGGGKLNPKALNLNDVVAKVYPVQDIFSLDNIRVERHLDPDLSLVKADPGQMEVVLTNLYVKAVEATEGGGCIRITTGHVGVDKTSAKRHPGLEPGRYVSLSVEDTGCGMDPETKSKVFEPFFTTKFLGRGLGLAAAYGIVGNHGGSIFVESEEGHGSTFTVLLPALEGELGKLSGSSSETLPEAETLLVIDADSLGLKIMKKALELSGYNVLAASNGGEAVGIAQTYDGPIHVVLLDSLLPDTPSVEVYGLLKEARPSMKGIIISERKFDPAMQTFLDLGVHSFLQKPVAADDLAGIVRRVLDR